MFKDKTILLLLAGSVLFAHACFLILPGVFETWNVRAVDRLFQYRSLSEKFAVQCDPNIVHVDIDDTSLGELGTYYLNRTHYAKAVENLAKMNVAGQMHDFIFAARDSEEEDAKLIQTVSEAGNVWFGMAFKTSAGKPESGESQNNMKQEIRIYLEKTKWPVKTTGDVHEFYTGETPLMTFHDLASVSGGLGFLNAKPDPDGIFRRIPLLIRYRNAFYPSLAFIATCRYLNITPENIIVRPGKQITLKNARFPAGSGVRDIVIPVDKTNRMRINFVGPWERMRHFHFVDIITAHEYRDKMDAWRDEFEGKLVMVSDVSTGSSDTGPIPADIDYPLSGLHANAVNTIVTESFLKELSDMEMLFIELFLIFPILFFSVRFSSLPFSLGTIALGIAYYGVVSLSFLNYNVIFNIVRPLLMISVALIVLLIYRFFNEEKEKAVLQTSFEAYFPPAIVRKIMANPEIITEDGYKKELTILFSDIKSFTSHSSAMEPVHIRKLLNEYFGAMTEIVFKYEGTVDKFIGDGLMVFFGDPDPQPDHAVRCTRAAIEMQEKVAELREKWKASGNMPLHIRIGINTGVVAVGNMGSLKRLSYTVIGAPVNMAQRLESNAPVDGILISRRTCEMVKDSFSIGPVRQIKVKGYQEPIDVYEVLSE